MALDPIVSALRAPLVQLQAACAQPVALVAAGWRQGAEVNLDERAARALAHLIRSPLSHDPTRLTLVLLARGGALDFADGVRRALADVQVTSLIPSRIDGAISLAALASDALRFAPEGALGAYDIGPLGPPQRVWCPERAAALHMPLAQALGEEGPRVALALANQRVARRHASSLLRLIAASRERGAWDALTSDLSVASLGEQVGLGAHDLARLDLDARPVDGPVAAALEALTRACDEALSLFDPPRPRYEPTTLADEVEFELATSLPAGIIATVDAATLCSLDTGRPHPDTGLFEASWHPLSGWVA